MLIVAIEIGTMCWIYTNNTTKCIPIQVFSIFHMWIYFYIDHSLMFFLMNIKLCAFMVNIAFSRFHFDDREKSYRDHMVKYQLATDNEHFLRDIKNFIIWT